MRIHTYITQCEVRRVTEGVRSKDGKPFMLIKAEDMEGDQFEATCNSVELFPSIGKLKKGDVVDLPCTVMATDRYQFVSVDGAPELAVDDSAGF